MQFIASLAAFAVIPFALLAMMPVRLGTAMAAGLFVSAVAFGFAMTGTDYPVLPATLILSGALCGLVTAGIRLTLSEHDAPWHAGVVALAAGAAACLPVWLAMTFGVGLLVTGLSG